MRTALAVRDAQFEGAKLTGVSFVKSDCDGANFARTDGAETARWAGVRGQTTGLPASVTKSSAAAPSRAG